jgi:hypothetical protein
MRIRQVTPPFGRPVLIAAVLTLWPGVAVQARAQETAEAPPAKERHTWLNIGIAGSPDGLGLVGSVSFKAADPLLITARGTVVDEIQFCPSGSCTTPPDRVYELAVLPGLVAQNSDLLASLSAGVGVIVRTYSEPPTVTEIGLPVELQLYLLPTRSVGFGVTGLANFNRSGTFWAVVLGLQIGL